MLSSQWQDFVEQSPALSDQFTDFHNSFQAQHHIPTTVLELCRLRIAQLHGNPTPPPGGDVALSAEQINHLSSWHSHSAFSDEERACLSLAEVYVMDCQAVTDEHAQAVKTHFGDAGLVALVQALGVYYGMTRLGLMWNLS